MSTIFTLSKPSDPLTFDGLIKQLLANEEETKKLYLAPVFIPSSYNYDFGYDKKRQKKKIIRVFYDLLIDDWLYNDPMYNGLLPYFNISTKNDEIKISVVPSLDKLHDKPRTEEEKRLIMWYIEKHYVHPYYVKQILREFVKTHHLNWSDLYTNKRRIREYLYYAIKQLIVTTINEGLVK